MRLYVSHVTTGNVRDVYEESGEFAEDDLEDVTKEHKEVLEN
ncbi:MULTISPECIES: hypothetical protein [Enterococcus]|uniref:Uncharacterized protein n=1 Tax=Enterococcus canis TaxID=214095 RepID=A0A1L8RCJ3_9ENTE|nr:MULTISPECIES: hypothetical protein [Enterococcus]EZP98365.1 hypothetical protein Z971_12960 [Enterococcus faecium VRE0576]OJG17412.1 hypothetical protein RU97_GL000598 [Enterococcus canis]UXK05286.1 hypothetical protein N7K38_05925 [Enterococcus raffinosus]